MQQGHGIYGQLFITKQEEFLGGYLKIIVNLRYVMQV